MSRGQMGDPDAIDDSSYEIEDAHNDAAEPERYFYLDDDGPLVSEHDLVYCGEYPEDPEDEPEDPDLREWDAMTTFLRASDPADWASDPELIANAIRAFYHATDYKTPDEVNKLMERYGDRIPAFYEAIEKKYLSYD